MGYTVMESVNIWWRKWQRWKLISILSLRVLEEGIEGKYRNLFFDDIPFQRKYSLLINNHLNLIWMASRFFWFPTFIRIRNCIQCRTHNCPEGENINWEREEEGRKSLDCYVTRDFNIPLSLSSQSPLRQVNAVSINWGGGGENR